MRKTLLLAATVLVPQLAHAANTDLIEPLESETFSAPSATATLSVGTASGFATIGASSGTVQVAYDATSRTYTITEGTRTQKFAQANLDPARSGANAQTYVVRSGTTTDTFTRLVTGTASGQTRYVTAGFWQRQINGTSTVDGRFTSMVYGVQTPAAGMPRTGTASFDVRWVGEGYSASNLYMLTGNGQIVADFGLGLLGGGGAVSGVGVSAPVQSLGLWSATARIASGGNTLNGTIAVDGYGDAPLRGGFYGPAANELGAVFSSGANGYALSGTLVGARGTVASSKVPFDFADNVAFTGVEGVSLSGAYNDTQELTSIASASPVVALFYNGHHRFSWFLADGGIFSTQSSGSYGGAPDVGSGFVLEEFHTARMDAILYGNRTALSAMPRSGRAVYAVGINAGLGQVGQKLNNYAGMAGPAFAFNGNGVITVNFADGALVTRGDYILFNRVTGTDAPDRGSWSGTARIGSGTSAFSGNFTLDGDTDYTGTWRGRFFGAKAGSIGALLDLSSTAGARVAGTLVGAIDPAATAAYTPLLRTPALDQLTGIALVMRYAENGMGGYRVYDSKGGLLGAVTPSQLALGLALRKDGGLNLRLYGGEKDITLTPSAIIAGQTTPAVVTYALPSYFNDGSGRWTTARLKRYVFDGVDGRIKLSYTDLAEVFARGGTVRSDTFLAFGKVTPASLFPRSGKAVYNGVLLGRGVGFEGRQSESYALSGAATLTANFARSSFTADLAITGKGDALGHVVDFGNFSFSGSFGSQGGFYAKHDSVRWQGVTGGNFFGPGAEEVGGAYDILLNVAHASLRGVFAATSGN